MIARIIIDRVRRTGSWHLPLWPIVGVVGFKAFVESGMLSTESFFAASLTVAFVYGPLMAITLTPREVLQLPLSRRDFWRARWIVSVPLPTVGLAIVMALAHWIHIPWFDSRARAVLSGQMVVLSVLYDLVYLGVMFRVMILLAGRSSRPQTTSLARAESLAVLLAFMGGFGWPWLISRWLPLQFSTLSGMSALLLTLGVANAIAGYFHQPGSSPHQSRRFVGVRSKAAPLAESRSEQNYLTGLPLLLWREVRSVGTGVVMMVGMVAVMEWFEPSVMRWDSPGFPFFLWMVAMPFAGPAMKSLRHLRALPVTMQTLENILLGRALLGTVLLGGCWWIAWRMETGHAPLFVDMPILFLVLGIRILGDVADIRWQNRNLPKMPLVVGIFLGGTICGTLAAKHGVPYVFPAYGLCVVVGSVVALHRTLTRSSTAYRPRRLMLPFGVAPGA